MIILDTLEYSFADELAVGFSYDSEGKRISITFESYYKNNQYVEKKCTLTIESWTEGESKMHGQEKYGELESNLGIPSLLLGVDQSESMVVLTINTLDDRYLVLRFVGAHIKVNDV
ncbi:hypothetical protein [Psychromonas arctica]|uniref:hypothetical protein n=1 Tax=Psychromonas arctica TaxID=168275 RepID=UPI002FD76FFE